LSSTLTATGAPPKRSRSCCAKDDPTDAEVILELLVRHRDKLKRLEPESADMRALRRLVEWRRDLVQDRTRLTNRITDALKAYFPQVLEWFPDKEAAIFADFLERWPTLQHAQRARRETLEAFFRAGNVRSASSIEKRVKAIGEERPLHTDEAVIGPARLLVEALLPHPSPLLAGPRALRRIPLPHGPAEARRAPAQARGPELLIHLAAHLRA